MSAELDQIIDRIASTAPVLFVAKEPSIYQPGCGAGRPKYWHVYLTVRRAGAANIGGWVLPRADDGVADQGVEEAEFTGSVSVVEGDQFKPALGEKYDDAQWLPADFFAAHPWCDPLVQKAVQEFELEHEPQIPRYPADNSKGDEMQTESRQEFIDAQMKADQVAKAFNDSAPPPMAGEKLMAYRVRLARQFQAHSKQFKDSDLSRVGDPVAFAGVERAIYADAMTEAKHPTTSLRPGETRAIVTNDISGRPVTRHVGHKDDGPLSHLNPPFRYVRRLMTPGAAVH